MTWDENDLNTAYRVDRSTYERWEGVIASASTEPNYEMIRVGGPDCGPVNKRYEIILQPKSQNEYYYNPGDRRIHLKNSDKAWLKVDYDYDTKVDMTYEWLDKDQDGIKDQISLDVDGDGIPDDTWKLDISGVTPIEWKFNDVYQKQSQIVKTYPQQLYALNKALVAALERKEKGSGSDSVWNMIERKMKCEGLDADRCDRLLQSDESLLYYLNLAADRRIVRLKKIYADSAFWDTFYKARSKGDLQAMTESVDLEFNLPSKSGEYTAWLNALRSKSERKKVAWDDKWVVPNIGWESEKVAFRCYDGHFDIFGKRVDSLIYPQIAIGASYHKDTNGWGMDILHVNKTGGLGGLILYVNGKAYPLRNEKQPGDPVYSTRLFKETNDEVVVELKVTGIGPKENPYTATILASARAGKDDSQLDVRLTGGRPSDDVQLGIVLRTLSQESFFLNKETGFMGVWGFQDPGIGWVGLGVIFPASRFLYMDKQPEEYCAVLRYTPGETLRYYAQGDWLRAHRFGPTAGSKDWQRKLELKAAALNLQ